MLERSTPSLGNAENNKFLDIMNIAVATFRKTTLRSCFDLRFPVLPSRASKDDGRETLWEREEKERYSVGEMRKEEILSIYQLSTYIYNRSTIPYRTSFLERECKE